MRIGISAAPSSCATPPKGSIALAVGGSMLAAGFANR
jgi:hypothetical protein